MIFVMFRRPRRHVVIVAAQPKRYRCAPCTQYNAKVRSWLAEPAGTRSDIRRRMAGMA